MKNEKVVVTGTGAVAGAIVRALVPAGYTVTTLSLEKKGLTVFRRLYHEQNPQSIEAILKGNLKVDPFLDLSTKIYQVPNEQIDLSEKKNLRENPFEGADSVILTAANADPKQNEASASRNNRIDVNCIESAISVGVKKVIYTSSVWRTFNVFEDTKSGIEKSVFPEEEAASDNPYARRKAESVRYLKNAAEKNSDKIFFYIDLGWYPRTTIGYPISNLSPRLVQWWIAECEMQQHYLLMLNLSSNKSFQNELSTGVNFFGFNGFSKNEPPEDLTHPKFRYDLTNSLRLGVKHEFNVYDVLKKRSADWRRIPVVDN